MRGWLMAAVMATLTTGVVAQSPSAARTPHIEYEDRQVRVIRWALAPNERTTSSAHPPRVIVFLSRDLHGKVPPSPVEWQEAGTSTDMNEGNQPFEAVVVELKGQATDGPLQRARAYTGVAQVQLINNPQVEVRRMVVGPGAVAPNPGCHTHRKPEVFVHLADAKDITGVVGGSQPVSVKRGQVTILVPGQKHFFTTSQSGLADFIDIHAQGDPSTPQADCS